jgi:glycosyl transferase family 25
MPSERVTMPEQDGDTSFPPRTAAHRRPAETRIVFINLDRAAERRRFMEAQGERLHLGFERMAAVEASGISDATAAEIGRSWERPLTKPELGCFLSHQALWRQIAAGTAPLLVLEDDVMLSPRLGNLLEQVADLSGIELINLENFARRRFLTGERRPLIDGLALLGVARDKSGSAAYLLWPEGARKLLRRAERGAAPVDAFLHGLKALASFQVEPALAMQVHLLEQRRIPVPIPTATSIQVPRGRLPMTPGNLPFHLRRAATQIRLLGEHVWRLFGHRYRLVDIVEAEFQPPADQSRS